MTPPITRRALLAGSVACAATSLPALACESVAPAVAVPSAAVLAIVARIFIAMWRDAGNAVTLAHGRVWISGEDGHGIRMPAREPFALVNRFAWDHLRPHVVAALAAEQIEAPGEA